MVVRRKGVSRAVHTFGCLARNTFPDLASTSRDHHTNPKQLRVELLYVDPVNYYLHNASQFGGVYRHSRMHGIDSEMVIEKLRT